MHLRRRLAPLLPLATLLAGCGDPAPAHVPTSVAPTPPPPPSPAAIAAAQMERGLEARLAGDHDGAKRAFLAAHEALAPHGDALFEASREASKLGEEAEAKELLGRAREELIQVAGAPFTLGPFETWWSGVHRAERALPVDAHRFVLDTGDLLIVDPRTERMLDVPVRGLEGARTNSHDEDRAGTVAISPDKRTLGVLARVLVPWPRQSLDNEWAEDIASFVDLATGETVVTVPARKAPSATTSHGMPRPSIAFSRDGARAFTVGGSPTAPFAVYEVTFSTRKSRAFLPPPRTVPLTGLQHIEAHVGVALSDDGRVVAASYYDRVVAWDLASAKVLASADAKPGTAVELSADGRWVAFVAPAPGDPKHGIASVLDTRDGSQLALASAECSATLSSVDRTGRLAAGAGGKETQGCASVWDLSQRAHLRTFPVDGGRQLRGFAPDGRSLRFDPVFDGPSFMGLPSAERDAWPLVDSFDVATGARTGPAVPEVLLDVTPPPRRIHRDLAKRIVQVDDGRGGAICSFEAPAAGGQIHWLRPDFLQLSPDTHFVVVGGYVLDDDPSFRDAATCELRWSGPARLDRKSDRKIRFLADGRLSIDGSGGLLSHPTLWDLEKGTIATPPAQAWSDYYSLEATPDGPAIHQALRPVGLLSGAPEKTARNFRHSDDTTQAVVLESAAIGVWDLPKNKLLRRIPFKDAKTAAIHGAHVYAANGREAAVWEVATGREIVRLPHKAPAWTSPAFSADGQAVALLVDGRVRVHELAHGKELGGFETSAPEELMLGGGGKYLAVQYKDHQVTVVETATGTVKRKLGPAPNGPAGNTRTVALHPTAPLVVRTDRDGVMTLYRFDREDAPPVSLFVDSQGRAGVAAAGDRLELAGEPSRAEALPRCYLGVKSYPFDLCRDAVVQQGLVAAAIAP